MAIDTRDHYIERLRKRTRYVERSSFRMSEKDKASMRRRAAWRRIFALLLLIVLAVAARRFFAH